MLEGEILEVMHSNDILWLVLVLPLEYKEFVDKGQ